VLKNVFFCTSKGNAAEVYRLGRQISKIPTSRI